MVFASHARAGRVRNRIQAAEADISDDVVNEFIADEQAFVETYAQKSFAESDPQLGLARSICTDRCAAKALVYLSAPSASISYTIAEKRRAQSHLPCSFMIARSSAPTSTVQPSSTVSTHSVVSCCEMLGSYR